MKSIFRFERYIRNYPLKMQYSAAVTTLKVVAGPRGENGIRDGEELPNAIQDAIIRKKFHQISQLKKKQERGEELNQEELDRLHQLSEDEDMEAKFAEIPKQVSWQEQIGDDRITRAQKLSNCLKKGFSDGSLEWKHPQNTIGPRGNRDEKKSVWQRVISELELPADPRKTAEELFLWHKGKIQHHLSDAKKKTEGVCSADWIHILKASKFGPYGWNTLGYTPVGFQVSLGEEEVQQGPDMEDVDDLPPVPARAPPPIRELAAVALNSPAARIEELEYSILGAPSGIRGLLPRIVALEEAWFREAQVGSAPARIEKLELELI